MSPPPRIPGAPVRFHSLLDFLPATAIALPLAAVLVVLSLKACVTVQSPETDENPESSGKGTALTVTAALLPEVRENASPPVAVEAKRVFSNTKEATYQHKIEIDEHKGVYNLDCSGFVEYALRRSTPRAAGDLDRGVAGLAERAGKKIPKRPLAKHFVQYFDALEEGKAASENWVPVKKVQEMKQGDVLAWLMPAEIESRNTGHVMIVRDAPRPHPAHPNEWIVPIIDSTSRKHGASDSRAATGATGLGVGEVVVIADAEGNPKGYRWSVRSRNARSTEVSMARALR